MNLKPFLNDLSRELRRPDAPYPLHTGVMKDVTFHGVTYYLLPSERARDNSWFHNTKIARYKAQQHVDPAVPLYLWEDKQIHAFIHWPYFLWQARPGNNAKDNPMAPLARRLLVLLADHIELHDAILAMDIRAFDRAYRAAAPEYLEKHPEYYGLPDDPDGTPVLRFHNHLHALLHNKPFTRELHAVMNNALLHVRAVRDESRMGLCPRQSRGEKPHARRATCPDCAGQRWQRKYSSLLKMDRINDPMRQALCKLPRPESKVWGSVPARWPQEIRYMLHGTGPYDGAFSRHGKTLVNFEMLVRRAVEQNRACVLSEFYNAEPVDPYYYAGSAARLVFARAYGTEVLAARDRPLKQMVIDAGWTWKETGLDVPYEVYDTLALTRIVAKNAKAARKLVRRNRTPLDVELARGRRAPRHYVALEWEGRPVKVFRRQRTFSSPRQKALLGHDQRYILFFSIPFPDAMPAPPKHHSDRRNVVIQLAGESLWSASAIKQAAWSQGSIFVQEERKVAVMETVIEDGVEIRRPVLNALGEPAYEYNTYVEQAPATTRNLIDSDLLRFYEWAAAREAELRIPSAWRKALFNMHYATRKGELSNGLREHLGPFAEPERKVIDEFLHARRKATPPRKGRLSESEWAELIAKLPGRGKLGIQRYLLKIGLEYAKDHGWTAYVKSPYCFTRSARRKALWQQTEGVR